MSASRNRSNPPTSLPDSEPATPAIRDRNRLLRPRMVCGFALAFTFLSSTAFAEAKYWLYKADFSTRPKYKTETRFLISKEFSKSEARVIVRAIKILSEEYRKHFKQYYGSKRKTSAYIRELVKSYTKDAPRLKRRRDKEGHAALTMTCLAYVANLNKRRGSSIRIHRFYERNNTWGRAGVKGFVFDYKKDPAEKAQHLRNGRLIIKLNAYNLRKHSNRESYWAGTIFHEILHQCGYKHPSGYKGSLIKEAGLVVARRAKSRGFGLTGGKDFGYSINE